MIINTGVVQDMRNNKNRKQSTEKQPQLLLLKCINISTIT